MTMDRRNFIKNLSLATGALLTGPAWLNKAHAATKDSNHNFIFCYFNGGWDNLLCLDPRDPGKFPDSKKDETSIELAWDRLEAPFKPDIIMPKGSKINFGPAIGNFAKHYDKSCVIRGISMNTLTHQVGKLFFLTGQPPRGLSPQGSSMSTRIVSQLGDNSAIPSLSLRVQNFNNGHPAFASALNVNSVTDLIFTLKKSGYRPDQATQAAIDEYRKKKVYCDSSGLNNHGLITQLERSLIKSAELSNANLFRHFNFFDKNNPEMVKLKAQYDIRNTTSPNAQAATALQALKMGISQAVTIELTGGLDTHDEGWATDHPEKLKFGFDLLSLLIDDLEKTPHPKVPSKKLIDLTTIVVFSEFGRTPTLNNRDGRDHSLNNSCLLVGARIPHNRVIGGSSPNGMNSMGLDQTSGEPSKTGGYVITPKEIFASLMKNSGLDYSEMRTEAIPALLT